MGLQLFVRLVPVYADQWHTSIKQEANEGHSTSIIDSFTDNDHDTERLDTQTQHHNTPPDSPDKWQALYYNWIGTKFPIASDSKGFTLRFTNIHGIRKPKSTLGDSVRDLVATLQEYHISFCGISEHNLPAYLAKMRQTIHHISKEIA